MISGNGDHMAHGSKFPDLPSDAQNKENGITLLVADDFPEDQEFLSDLADQVGLRVTGFATQRTEVFTALETRLPDCLVMDYKLGTDNGVELIGEIREVWPLLPVILVSGALNQKVAAAALAGGATRYLAKRGLDAPALCSAVEEAVRWGQSQSAKAATTDQE